MRVARPVTVVLLLVLAALASRARQVVSLGVHGPLGEYVGPLLNAFLVAAAAGAAAFLTLVVVAIWPRRRKRNPEDEWVVEQPPYSRWSRLLAMITALSAALVLLVPLLFLDRTPSPSPAKPGAGPANPAPAPTPPQPGSLSPAANAANLVPILILAALGVLALAGLVAVSWNRLRPSAAATVAHEEPGEAARPLASAVAAGRRALRDQDSPRAAIIACYAAMEQRLADAGTPRRPADTPTELLDRACRAGFVRTQAARALTALFARARFSRHPIDSDDQRSAAQALDDISRYLGNGR